MRERRIVDDGREPVALWVIVACGIVLLIAGGVLGNAGSFFDYKSTFQKGYVRGKAPGAADEGPLPKPALVAFSARGAKIYSKCNGCHGADGKGDGINYPSLAGSKFVTGDTETLAMIILNGIQGPTSSGKIYGAGIMPAQGAGMSADDLAGVMTYVRNSFGNASGDVVTIEMAGKALEISAARAKAAFSTVAAKKAAHSFSSGAIRGITSHTLRGPLRVPGRPRTASTAAAARNAARCAAT